MDIELPLLAATDVLQKKKKKSYLMLDLTKDLGPREGQGKEVQWQMKEKKAHRTFPVQTPL